MQETDRSEMPPSESGVVMTGGLSEHPPETAPPPVESPQGEPSEVEPTASHEVETTTETTFLPAPEGHVQRGRGGKA